jgi:hypothetical protein
MLTFQLHQISRKYDVTSGWVLRLVSTLEISGIALQFAT